jgi:hypothetical protein
MNFLRNLFRVPFHTYLQVLYFGIVHIYRVIWNIAYKNIFQPLEERIHYYSKKEPIETKWLEVYKLNESTCNSSIGIPTRFYSSETYYYYPHNDDFEQFLESEYPLCLSQISGPAMYDREMDQIPDTLEALFVARNDEKYMFRSIPMQTSLSNTFSMKESVTSEVEFIVAEYTHPKMSKAISIDIPKGYYLAGNELFSPAFIQRFLELQKEYYIFDDEYVISILDSEVEEHKITFDQYVKLDEKSYSIYKISQTKPLQLQSPSELSSRDSFENKMTNSTSNTENSYHLDFSDASSNNSENNSIEEIQTTTSSDSESSIQKETSPIEWWDQYIKPFL